MVAGNLENLEFDNFEKKNLEFWTKNLEKP